MDVYLQICGCEAISNKMAEGYGNAKKQKTEERDTFLKFFSKEIECRSFLRAVTDLISGTGTNPLVACPLKIIQADANMTRAFSSAICMTEFHMNINNPSKPYTVNIGTLFDTGCVILLEFFENKKVPGDREARRALRRLIEFLTINDYSGLFDSKERGNEIDWCVRVAQHLFGPLSTSKEYIIDNGIESSGMIVCPCSSKDQLYGSFGDTSFGCRNLWHGKVDVLFGTVPLVLGHSSDSSDTESESSESEASPEKLTSLEVKIADDFILKDKFKMRAQAIVFGFYQNRHSKKKQLIPSVGISKTKVVFRFYDSVNDVLLETHALDLCSYENNLSLHVVLLLWLTLNYKHFGKETPENLKPYKSQFHREFQSYISTYEQDVVAPCHVKPSLQKEKSLPKVAGEEVFDVEAVKQKITFKSIDEL